MKNPVSSRQFYQEFRKNGIQETEKESKKNKEATERKKFRSHHMSEYKQWLSPYSKGLGFVFFLATFGMLLEMVLPTATGRIIDSILLNQNLEYSVKMDQLNKWAAIILGTLIFENMIAAFRMHYMTILNSKIIFALRKRLFTRLIRLPLGKIVDLKSGGIVSRLSNDVNEVSNLIQTAIISPGVALIKVVIVLSILFSINWQLALAAAIALPPLTYVSVLWVKKGRPVYREMSKDRTRVDGRVAETFGGIRVVRSFGRERKEGFDYAIGNHTIIRKNIYARIFGITIDVGWSFLMPLVSLIIVWFGGYLHLKNSVTIGEIVTFQLYSTLLLQPIWRIVFSLSSLQKALASMDRVFEILGLKEDKRDRENAQSAPSKIESLEFKNVDFIYKNDKKIIKNFSLEVKGGETVAFVGASGAGKTTMTDLIARFYDPNSGAILVNGIDIRDIKIDEYRQLFGVVQQDVFLFDGTINENIAYGSRNSEPEEIIEASVKANADKFIRDLPDGYDTLIGERGIKLSGGQRQRLSIARAILADPQILILDEATSNLDSESEEHIQGALKELFADRTTFVIAHRLSTITHADKILVLNEGEKVEVGNHKELMAAKGAYFEMVERQRKSFTI